MKPGFYHGRRTAWGQPGGAGLCLALLLLALHSVQGQNVAASKHNLSSGGMGSARSSTESEICAFCHTAHLRPSQAPQWSLMSQGKTYVPYRSSTTKAVIGQPTGSSKLCLSCHDGTIAMGMASGMSRKHVAPSEFHGGLGNLPPGPARLGTDLSDDHPISFVYDSALAVANGQLRHPSTLVGPVRLDDQGQLQCTSCHDPHSDRFGKFLVQNNTASALCNACHDQKYWRSASHATSGQTWNGVLPNPWPHTTENTVQANGCENCHRPHGAGTRQRLLNYPGEESNCFPCHNGNGARKNIQSEFNKPSTHPVLDSLGIHDPAENLVNPSRHVECEDCHNPHASQGQGAAAPRASGALAGVRGVNAAGTAVLPLVNEYELCFRCHADSLTRGTARVNRQFVQTNTRLAFQPSNASYHPVETSGKSPVAPSLIAPWLASSVMYCTDCHNNNSGPGAGGAGPKGPHGSAYAPLLERRLELTDFQVESPSAYALCYKCHSRTSLLNDESFARHKLHVVDQKAACTTCHDPHGVQKNPYLINFNTTYVRASSRGPINYTSTGNRSGTCSLVCHGKDHSPASYYPGMPPKL